MNKVILILLSLSFLIGGTLSADQEVGNGGDGVMINGKPYLLDFVEQGVNHKPRFKNPQDYSKRVARKLQRSISLPGLRYDLLAAKIREIQRYSPVMAYFLIYASEHFLWRLAGPEKVKEESERVDLIDVEDEDSVIDLKKLKKVQLAIRRGANITISRYYWEKLTDENRVGLIFHELLYALVKPDKQSSYVWSQSQTKARAINGLIFSDRFKNMKKTAFFKLLHLNNLAELTKWSRRECYVNLGGGHS